jgi:hypothetical protein
MEYLVSKLINLQKAKHKLLLMIVDVTDTSKYICNFDNNFISEELPQNK